MCSEDDASLWVLRTMRTLLRLLPVASFGAEVRAGAVAVLQSAWERAESEQRPILLAALKRVGDAMARASELHE